MYEEEHKLILCFCSALVEDSERFDSQQAAKSRPLPALCEERKSDYSTYKGDTWRDTTSPL